MNKKQIIIIISTTGKCLLWKKKRWGEVMGGLPHPNLNMGKKKKKISRKKKIKNLTVNIRFKGKIKN